MKTKRKKAIRHECMTGMTLEQKLAELTRRSRYKEIVCRIRMNIFTYIDDGREDKAARLIEKINKRVVKPCKCCGA